MKSKQISESLALGIMLALAGGFMDAYSYVCRGHVFANAQTGNILLFGVNLAEGSWHAALRYLCPVLAFAMGIGLADIIRLKMKNKSVMHWRQITVLIEAAILFMVSLLPLSINLLANSLTSFACGIQVESFRKIKGNGIATTMCIGNLRTATQNLCEYWYTKDLVSARKSLLFFGIIGCFVTGAVIGNACVNLMEERALVICDIFLGAGFMMMFIDREKGSRKAA